MDRSEIILLVESDTRRRAAISHALSSAGYHVEPFETLEELAFNMPVGDYALANAATIGIAKLVDIIGQAEEWCPVLAFGEGLAPQHVVEAVLDGAVEFIEWPFDAAGFRAALDRAHLRVQTVGSLQMRTATARGRIEKLSGREREVLDGVASGLSNRRIADELSISPRTVEIHRANMLQKLGAKHSAEAIRLAIEADLGGGREQRRSADDRQRTKTGALGKSAHSDVQAPEKGRA